MTNSDSWVLKPSQDFLSNALKETLIKNKGWLYEPILGYLGGSAAYGFCSGGSDLDWFLLCKNEMEFGSKLLKKDSTAHSDLMLVGYNQILSIIHKLDIGRGQRLYPTVFYRSPEEDAFYKSANPYRGKDPSCFHKDDVKFFDLCIFLRAEMLWVNEKYKWFDLFALYAQIRTIDFLDAHFVRAYGNFQNFIQGQSQVAPRKYLYTIQHLLTMKWILEKGTKPPLNYLNFKRNMTFEALLKEHMDCLMNRNASAIVEKEKDRMNADVWLNHYIEEQLEILQPKLEQYDKDETYGDIMQQTPKHLMPTILLCDMSKLVEHNEP